MMCLCWPFGMSLWAQGALLAVLAVDLLLSFMVDGSLMEMPASFEVGCGGWKEGGGVRRLGQGCIDPSLVSKLATQAIGTFVASPAIGCCC